ncbi:PD-(D/E)XK nuclease family protein [Acetobacteraceae bacterium]|nr:PD-(D/E)XK nuclease family protein [Candidatus Parcubacteria bacterium]
MQELPIAHWSHSSLMAFLRNPLAWYKRYVELIYDTPSSPSGIVGRACHKAIEHYYTGISKEGAVALGLEYLRKVPDFEINFGKAKSRLARKKKREGMEREYLQAISFFMRRPPSYRVIGVEAKATVKVKGLPLPIKAVSDLVVKSKIDPRGLDVVDFKFVDSFTQYGAQKSLFVVQAIFNYYTARETFKKPVRRFIVHEYKKSKNKDGRSQLRTYKIDFRDYAQEFALFHRLIKDATLQLTQTRVFLPNPSDMFEGENSFDIYRLGLVED